MAAGGSGGGVMHLPMLGPAVATCRAPETMTGTLLLCARYLARPRTLLAQTRRTESREDVRGNGPIPASSAGT